MPDKPWKQTERRVARYLGTERNPGSGGSRTSTRSDSKHQLLFVEVKHGTAVPTTWRAIEGLFTETAVKAAHENKVPVLVFHRKNRDGGVEGYPSVLRVAVQLRTDDNLGVLRQLEPCLVMVPLRRVRDLVGVPG